MNVKALQWADQWLGVPLCFALTLARAIFGRSAPDSAASPRRVLFVKLAEQGSTVLAHVALRRAVEMSRREDVYFTTLEENRFILDLLGVVPQENVITVSFKNLPTLMCSALVAIRRLRRLRLDAAVDLEFFSRGSAALTFLSGARRRAGFHAFFGGGPYRGDLMTHRLLCNPHEHTSETFLSRVEALHRPPTALPSFNSVPLAAGRHRVALEYVPREFPVGGWISIAAAVGWLLLTSVWLRSCRGDARGVACGVANSNN